MCIHNLKNNIYIFTNTVHAVCEINTWNRNFEEARWFLKYTSTHFTLHITDCLWNLEEIDDLKKSINDHRILVFKA